jgi:hypothetical protein
MVRTRTRTTPLIELLRQTTYPLLYGVKTPIGPRPSSTKEKFVARYNNHIFKHTIRKLANYDYAAHFSGDQTFYFYGNPYWKAEKTLVMIDIDCHQRGALQGAQRFAEYLNERWPGLAFEVSTNGNGIHAYAFVAKYKRTVKEVKAALKNFDRYLKLLALGGEYDIENVEIKGLPPEIEYYKEGGIIEITYGSLAKLPRTLTYEQLSATTTFLLDELASLEVTDDDILAIKRWIHPEKPASKVSLSVGSISGQLIPEEELDNLDRYESFARRLMDNKELATCRGYVATSWDMAILLVILKVLYNNRNPQGTMPTRRIEALWTVLYESGDIDRPWNHHRYKVMRDWLSEQGHLDWEDHRYSRGQGGEKGVACKWSLTQEMYDSLLEIGKKEPSSMGSISLPEHTGEFLIPVLGVKIDNDWLFEAEERVADLFRSIKAA